MLDRVIESGNPADSTLAVNMIKGQSELLGKPPRQAAFDGVFSSNDNLAALKKLGVEDVALNKHRGLAITDMVKSSGSTSSSSASAGESIISFLKRCFGLDRCTWRSLDSFKAYTWTSIVSSNLLELARHAIALR